MMNKMLIWLLISAILPFLYSEEEVSLAPTTLEIGDSIDKVTEVLGDPTGKMQSGDFSIYYYKLGNVHMKSGKISSLNLITEETWESRQQAAAEAKELRRIKGEELLTSIKEDDEFSELPAENRLAFWEQFRRDYPEVDVYVLHAQAKIETEKIIEKKQEENRIAALERRVLNAEIEARKAAKAAETQRLFKQTRYNNRYPSVIYYPQSHIIRKTGSGNNRPKPVQPIYNGSTLSGAVVIPGLNLNINGSLGTQSTTTTNTSSGFVNGQNGVMKVQSSEGFIRSFY